MCYSQTLRTRTSLYIQKENLLLSHVRRQFSFSCICCTGGTIIFITDQSINCNCLIQLYALLPCDAAPCARSFDLANSS